MDSPCCPVLQELLRLDASSPEYEDQLLGALREEKYVNCVRNLEGDDPIRLIVDYLDQALDDLEPSGPAAQKCQRELRRISGDTGILPSSYAPPPHKLVINPNPFTSGGYGDVYKAKLDGNVVCVKRIRMYENYGPKKSLKIFCREAVAWRRLNHPNILPLLWINLEPLQLISDWMAGGELPRYIKAHPNVDRIGLVSDIANGLYYLHSCNVIHRDLKGGNILVDDCGHARISDFGLATIARNPESLLIPASNLAYTPRWSAPEILNEEEYTKAADIFSFAMVMVEVFSGAVPFKDKNNNMAIVQLMQKKRPPRPGHSALTDNLWQLMQRCWDHNPLARPDASQVVQVVSAVGSASSELLKELKRSSFYLPREPNSILGGKGQEDYGPREDLIRLANSLDEVLTIVGTTSTASVNSLSELKAICGSRVILPTSYTLSPDILRVDTDVFASGGYGDIYQATFNGSRARVKRVRIPHPKYMQAAGKAFCEGAITWKRLKHPNLVPLLGFTLAPLQLISEWMPNGNLPEYIKRNPHENVVRLLSDVATGLSYLHSSDVIHMELKGSNVLIDADGRARISDFGLAAVTTRENFAMASYQPEYSPRWSAPEVLSGESYSEASDVFAFGMLMAEAFSGTEPLNNLSGFNAALAIIKGARPPRPRHYAVTDQVWKLMRRCWDADPSLRPDAPAILRVLLKPWYLQMCLVQ